MRPDEIAALSKRLAGARQTKSIIEPDREALAPANMNEALKVALASMTTEPAAWKLGGTNQATRDVFGVTAPYFGPLAASDIFESQQTISREAYPEPLFAEPEIAVAFDRTFEPSQDRRDEKYLLAALAWVAPALEMPSTCLDNVQAAGVKWLVADRCAAGALVVGERFTPDHLGWLEASLCRVVCDDDTPVVGREGLIGGVMGAVAEALLEFGRCGIPVNKNVILSTGGLAPAVNVGVAHCIAAVFSDRSGLEFKVEARFSDMPTQ